MKYYLFLLSGFLILSYSQLYALPQNEADSTPVEENGFQENEEEENETNFSKSILAPEAPIVEKERKIGDSKWNQLMSDKAFKYPAEVEAPIEEPNRTGNWLNKLFTAIFDFFNTGVGKVVIWLIVAGLLCFILYRIFLANGSLLFSKKNKKFNNNTDELADDYVPENWEDAIQNAIQNKNWRLAVRHSYRYTIKLMGDRSIVQLAPAKTNYQYVNEVYGSQWHQPFLRMTRQYEFAWYGGFELQQQQFEQYYHLFTDIKKGLTT